MVIAWLRWEKYTYTDEGDIVLDFAMGSGSTCVAARNLGRKSIGIEKDDNYFNIARERIFPTLEQQ
jgi:site-specific DNA-methyltransferase (adenine-specific)